MVEGEDEDVGEGGAEAEGEGGERYRCDWANIQVGYMANCFLIASKKTQGEDGGAPT